MKYCIFLLAVFSAPGAVRSGEWQGDAVQTAAHRLAQAEDRIGLRSAAIDFVRDDSLGPEAYRIRATADGAQVASGGARGILWGAYALAEAMERNRRLPVGEIASSPQFAIREWWTAAFQANFNLPLGGAFDRPIEEISAVVRRTIAEAPRYGINTLQLMGRAGEGGIDLTWFLHYDEFPKLRSRIIGWGIERRTQEIRQLAREAHAHGLDFLLWDHELVFPEKMLEAYPEMRGVDYPYCFSHPLVMKFLNAKVDEFFRRLPEADGLDLTFAETHGYNILEHGGCRCAQCSRLTAEEKIRRAILAVYQACRRNGKRLELRSYNQLPAHAEVMQRALRGLPRDIPIVTKNTVVDFRGTDYPDNPMLGGFPGQQEVLELTATPEASGYGYIPALLGDFYRREIGKVALERKLAGIAIRTDYHLQYGHATFFTEGPPVTTFDTPNEFNVFAASRLAWRPETPLDGLWQEWTSARYGKKAAPVVENALRRTAAIAQGIFFVKGFSLLTHLNMVPHIDYIDGELDNSYLLAFFPRDAKYRTTYAALKHPTEQTIQEILAEKTAAAGMAETSREEIRKLDGAMPADEYGRLMNGLESSRDAALLWKQLAAVYFRLLRPKEEKEQLAAAIRALIDESCRIEKKSGRRWPVYPAARGTTAYRFAEEAMERESLCCISASCP